MCRKELHIHTFSNRESYKRVLDIVSERYGELIPKGVFYKIVEYDKDFGVNFSTTERNNSAYSELKGYIDYRWIRAIDYPFHDWDSLKRVIKLIGTHQDVCGEVTIEVV